MPTTLLLPLLLRIAGPVAFVLAAMIAGAMNKSVMMIPALAVTASAATVLIKMVSPFPALDLKAALSPDAPPQKPSPFRGAGKRLIAGLVGYSVAFGLAALIAALFQSTEFQPEIGLSDIGFFIVPALIAFVGAYLGARIGVNQMAGMMGQMQDMFAQMQSPPAPGDEDGFTFEGEIIDPDEPKS